MGHNFFQWIDLLVFADYYLCDKFFDKILLEIFRRPSQFFALNYFLLILGA